MLILGLDPGSLHTGFGLVERSGSSVTLVEAGRFSCPRTLAVPARLAHLAACLDGLLRLRRPDMAALETPFHGLNVRSLVVLAEARGALLAVLAAGGIEIVEYSPAEVKSAVTGNGRADKAQVARMVGLLLGGALQAPRTPNRTKGTAERANGVADRTLCAPVHPPPPPNRTPPPAGAQAPAGRPLAADATDALALALCCAQRLRFDRLRASSTAVQGRRTP